MKYLSIIVVALFVSVYSLLFFLPKPPLLQDIPFSTAVYDSQHQLLRLTLSQDEKYRLFTPLSQVSQQLVEATLLQEDQYYRWHYGVNPMSLVKALWQTYVVHSRRIGASTISMQVARLRLGMTSKTFAGKCWQIIRAIQLEMHYSKNEILEAYLNLAPYGRNIEGVGAASLIYFNTTSKRLTLPQALSLSVIPQNPIKRNPHHQDLKQSRDHLFQRWLQQHPQDANKMSLFRLPLAMRDIGDLPFRAPHFVNWVLKKEIKTSDQKEIYTTLDSGLQLMIERITHRYLARKRTLGVYNATVLLIDTKSMAVKASMGSANFFNPTIGGQINGVEIKRSPGSTLKPFIYGLALDQGLIHPNTVLKDVPHRFNGYNPENFDYDFMGPIKAKDALVLSRNIPAIFLSSSSFFAFTTTGFDKVKDGVSNILFLT